VDRQPVDSEDLEKDCENDCETADKAKDCENDSENEGSTAQMGLLVNEGSTAEMGLVGRPQKSLYRAVFHSSSRQAFVDNGRTSLERWGAYLRTGHDLKKMLFLLDAFLQLDGGGVQIKFHCANSPEKIFSKKIKKTKIFFFGFALFFYE
jgi:hypothetical protein